MQLYYRRWYDVPTDDWPWRNFSPEELACKGTKSLLINPAALDALQRLRDLLGKPMSLNSAYRSPVHNANVGGAPNSKHMMGIAFDVRNSTVFTRDELIAAAKDAGFRGIKRYRPFTHLDMRADAWEE